MLIFFAKNSLFFTMKFSLRSLLRVLSANKRGWYLLGQFKGCARHISVLHGTGSSELTYLGTEYRVRRIVRAAWYVNVMAREYNRCTPAAHD